MNTDLHFSSKTDDWATPQCFFDKWNRIFHFQLDARNHLAEVQRSLAPKKTQSYGQFK